LPLHAIRCEYEFFALAKVGDISIIYHWCVSCQPWFISAIFICGQHQRCKVRMVSLLWWVRFFHWI